MHKCERYTDGSSIKPLKSGQTYEPYKTQGRWSGATFDELCLLPNLVHTGSEHVHINPFSLIPSAIILCSILSFNKHMHIFVIER